MAAKFRPAPEVQALAHELMNTVESHEHLAGAQIVYLFRDGAWESKGKVTLGQAKILSAFERHLLDPDRSDDDRQCLAVIINGDMWIHLTNAQKLALVDHELSHFVLDVELDRWKIAGHDLEEFAAVVRRHGLWMDDVRRFARATRGHIHQLDIDDLAGMVRSGQVELEVRGADHANEVHQPA